MVAPLIGAALISGGASVLGGIGGSLLSAGASANNTGQQIAWEREKMKHAHQWEMQDLRAAGLNPVLTARGSGASGGSISPQMPDYSGITSAGRGIAEAAQSAIINAQNQESITADKNLKTAETMKTYSEIGIDEQREMLLKAQVISELSKSKLLDRQATSALKSDLLMEQQINESKTKERQMRAEVENLKIQEERTKKEILLLKEELKNAPNKKRALEIQNDINEKESKIYYYREAAKTLLQATSVGVSIWGTYKASKFFNHKMSEKVPTTHFTERYNSKGQFTGDSRSYSR